MSVDGDGVGHVTIAGPAQPRLDIRAAFSTIPKVFRLAWQAHRVASIALVLITLLAAAVPAAQAWVAKMIVDSVVQVLNAGLTARQGLNWVLPYLLFELVLITLGALFAEGRMLLQRMLSGIIRFQLNTAIMDKSLALDLQYFENAAFYDQLQNARNETEFRVMTMIETCFTMIQNLITFASFLVILLAFSPLITLLLVVATIPSLIVQMRYSDMFVFMLTMRAPEHRRMNYLEHLLTVDNSAKEVKLFGLGQPLLQRYQKLFWKFHRQEMELMERRSVMSLFWGMLTTLSYYGAYVWIVWRTINGSITLGDLTLYLVVFRQAQTTVLAIFSNTGELYESGRFMENLFSFLRLKPQMASAADPLPVPRPIRQGIEFRNVSFRYPGRKQWALRDVSLHIAPGEKLALVGANGAGKTTFVKLLTRLYDPTEGEILLDGVDLREYDLDDLRQRIGVIFQDFVRYHATARENIGFGQIDALDDDRRIADAAQRGGADEVIATLPRGYDTMLGAWFEMGHELSGGQWQKIALGRAFMRDGEVLVLDEPTSALDAEREYDIFQRFRALTKGKIALLISHRFSTVRMADHICVLEGGRLTEYGTHEELLLLGGTYDRLFNLQAAGYR
ncbi:MAG TPA: ABC transporter ATP-binding protein [Herpetosiphonaceae bacterium]